MEKKGQMEKILAEEHYGKSLGTTLMCRGKEIQSSLEIFIFCKRKNRSTMSRNWRSREGISLAKTEFDFTHVFHCVNNSFQIG